MSNHSAAKKTSHLAIVSSDATSQALEVDPAEELEEDFEWMGWEGASPESREHQRMELQSRIAAYLTTGRPRVVVTDNLHTMLSIKKGADVWTLRLHHMFLDAPSMVVRALSHYAQRQDRDAADLLRAFIDTNDKKIRKRDQPRPVALDVEGRHYNLEEIFNDLNERYFDDRIQARITWGPRGRRKARRESIRLGSYTVEDALIRIHPVLDAADVPRFFVESVVHHEMLHEIFDMPIIDGRRVYHTAEFRRAEAEFEHFAAAVMWEKANLHKLLER